MRTFWIFILLLSILLSACHRQTVGGVLHELQSDEKSQLLLVGNYTLEFKFIPRPLYYLIFSHVDSNSDFSKHLLDSIELGRESEYGLMFSMTISPKEDTLAPTDFRNDVVYGQIAENENYRETFNRFTSGLLPKIWVEIEGKKFNLQTYHMTNSWGMTKSRSFTLVFGSVKELLPAKKGKILLVVENLVPGQGRDKIPWQFPISKNDFI